MCYDWWQIHHSLQQRAQKRTSLVLSMEEMSPKLATLKNTVISMPGASSDGQVGESWLYVLACVHGHIKNVFGLTIIEKLSVCRKHKYLMSLHAFRYAFYNTVSDQNIFWYVHLCIFLNEFV